MNWLGIIVEPMSFTKELKIMQVYQVGGLLHLKVVFKGLLLPKS